MSKVFFDTNILVYSVDDSDKRKRDACREILKSARKNGTGVISTQVLQEFYVATTRKLGMDPFLAKEAMISFEAFETITISPKMIGNAIDCQILSRLSFWDALIIAAAESAQCSSIYSEDMNPGQVIRGVKIENPLAIAR